MARPQQLATGDEVAAGIELSGGAAKVWAELHRLALEVHRERMTAKAPDAVTFHLPAVILAALVDYSERHLYRLLDELNAAGLIHSKGHTSKVGNVRRYDGTLFCVALKPGVRPRLRFWDFQTAWRADFEADYYGEKGAWREVQEAMSEPPTSQGRRAGVDRVALAWAVGNRHTKTPLEGGSDMRAGATFSTLADQLPAFLGMHPKQRHRAISEWGAALAGVLGEPHRLKQWCGAVYRALDAENQLRPALRSMADELRKFAAELRQGEGEHLRNAGAVLAARLKAATN